MSQTTELSFPTVMESLLAIATNISSSEGDDGVAPGWKIIWGLILLVLGVSMIFNLGELGAELFDNTDKEGD